MEIKRPYFKNGVSVQATYPVLGCVLAIWGSKIFKKKVGFSEKKQHVPMPTNMPIESAQQISQTLIKLANPSQDCLMGRWI
ncbi:MAG: hypothetical protein CMJ19_21070 [Phycisphaeraceae bacterium]|nr:hypothetical protein [Phycisphaeraceae bacterium]